ncbi:MAG: potassium-transporting ATPase subunit F [Alphaproteobacteria bacterium]|jgi:K+-transporting ATPase KdpF subunit|nr:potassium-transporting ATPase subunit F [Alphaproteobacteria bacterium]MBU1561843.1 potassium-transporting ATPase subunit F [Alphaproteobacteria bacterium]MBU2304559.1 potassium-transporting ATPase subunit F [Alphaproteobacteria bacterium]MBU2368109.1 potassium-transporting ATPase subunit F [Alphaproteobacteria bacterium]
MRAACHACEGAMLVIIILIVLGLAGYLLATLISPERF